MRLSPEGGDRGGRLIGSDAGLSHESGFGHDRRVGGVADHDNPVVRAAQSLLAQLAGDGLALQLGRSHLRGRGGGEDLAGARRLVQSRRDRCGAPRNRRVPDDGEPLPVYVSVRRAQDRSRILHGDPLRREPRFGGGALLRRLQGTEHDGHHERAHQARRRGQHRHRTVRPATAGDQPARQKRCPGRRRRDGPS